MGLTSCNNIPVQGEQGPAEQNGYDGADGSLILHGEGKNTDIYIDSTNGDLYQKENGFWTLVMNIKGEDGADGQDGHDGLNGSKGEDGATAYSNTILPSEGIVIGQNVGSAIEGSYFTLTAQDTNLEDEYDLVCLTLQYNENNETKTKELSIEDASEENGVYTWPNINMVKNGHVVSTKYGNNTQASDQTSLTSFKIKDGEEIFNFKWRYYCW